MNGENDDMGHTRARHFLKTFLKALATHDYESVEQLRRTLAIEHYRRSINRGEPISETEVVPCTNQVERWLSLVDKDFNELSEDMQALLRQIEIE